MFHHVLAPDSEDIMKRSDSWSKDAIRSEVENQLDHMLTHLRILAYLILH